MRATTLDQLLRELDRDQVTPVRYARRSLPVRLVPVLATLLLALAVTTSGVVLGRL
jgi:hypothetical protein